MRAKRRLLISLGAIVGVLLLAVGAAFIPPVQTWVARKALSSVAGQGSSLERVSVGLNRVSVRGLRVERNGAVLVVPSADAEIEVISAGFGRGIHVKSVVVKGWTLGLAHPGQGGAPGGSESAGSWVARAVGAVLAAFNVPADLSIDGVDLAVSYTHLDVYKRQISSRSATTCRRRWVATTSIGSTSRAAATR